VRKVEEKRTVLVAFDEVDTFGREASREGRLIGVELGDLLAIEQRQRRHLGSEGWVVF
jgi:hypothetical protein